MRKKSFFWLLNLLLVVGLLSLATNTQAETLRKRYTYDFNPATRRASEQKAERLARAQFVHDFLGAKFSKEIVDNLGEELDIALDPIDSYLLSFQVVSSKDDGEKIVLTVEGDVDLAGMVTALVSNKVLSFGERPPKILFLAAQTTDSPKATKSLRALMFDKLKQSGLQPVDSQGITEILSTQIKSKVTANSSEMKILQKTMVQYNADYLVYVDIEADNRPASIGGYICDANFTYTIVRPNNNIILAESLITTRGNGNTAMIAFDKALDKALPDISNQSIGQLYRAIYGDSDVVYNTVQQDNSISVSIYEAKPNQVSKIMEALQQTGSKVSLGVGTANVSKITVEGTLDTLGLFKFFNQQSLAIGNSKFKIPVVGYTENSIDIEVTNISQTPTRPASTTPPVVKPKPPKDNTLKSQNKSRNLPIVTLKLKPISYSK